MKVENLRVTEKRNEILFLFDYSSDAMLISNDNQNQRSIFRACSSAEITARTSERSKFTNVYCAKRTDSRLFFTTVRTKRLRKRCFITLI